MTTESDINRKGCLVTFFKNGDPHYKGFTTSISVKDFPSIDTLINWLSNKIHLPYPIRYIYQLPECVLLDDTSLFINGRWYVVSHRRGVKRVDYGKSKEDQWKNVIRLSAKRNRSVEPRTLDNGFPTTKPFPNRLRVGVSLPNSMSPSEASPRNTGYSGSHAPANRPKLITFVSNTNRKSKERVILNTRTQQTHEQLLADVGSILQMQYPPITAFWTVRAPYIKVKSLSHMFQTLRFHSVFLAVGQEGEPYEFSIDNEEVDTLYTKGLFGQEQQDTEVPVIQQINGYDHLDKPKAVNKATMFPEDHIFEVLKKDKSTLTTAVNELDTSWLHYSKDTFAVNGSLPTALNTQSIFIHGKEQVFFGSPHDQVKEDDLKPSSRLKLDWVYGYRGRDARNNLCWLGTGEILYNVAAVAVVYNPATDKQRHYMEHNEDITCLAVHPNKSVIASGQLNGTSIEHLAHIRIWDAATLLTITTLGLGDFHGSILALAFSKKCDDLPNGSLLVAVDESHKHSLSVWHWSKQQSIVRTKTTLDTVVWTQVHPKNHTIIITYGYQHVFFWKLFWDKSAPQESWKIKRDRSSGNFPDGYLPSFVTSLAFSLTGDVITGDSEGSLLLWQANTDEAYKVNQLVSRTLHKVHQKGIFALSFLTDDLLMSGAGTEVKLWNAFDGYSLVQSVSLLALYGQVRAFAFSLTKDANNLLYIGTTNNMILEGSINDNFQPVVQCHWQTCSSVTVSRNQQQFISVSDDRSVICQSMNIKAVPWRTVLEKPCLCVDLDPSNTVVAVGTTEGSFSVLSAATGAHIVTVQCCASRIAAIKYSSDSLFLALGAHDHNIYIYTVEDQGRYYKKYKNSVLTGHQNFLMHLDWSASSVRLRSVSANYDLLFWDISEMKELSAESCSSIKWATNTCILGYNLIGAWSSLPKGSDINTVDVSHNGQLLAVGENKGTIKLYRYPCSSKKAQAHSYKMFSGHVTKVVFTFDDHYLLTSGGLDGGILQWIVTP